MENQHRQIRGYRELDQAEIDLMNEVKACGEILQEKITAVMHAPIGGEGEVPALAGERARWVAIARTHLQQGLMALTRAVALPTFF